LALSSENFVTTTAYAGGLGAVAFGIGLIYLPLGVIAVGVSVLATVVLYTRSAPVSRRVVVDDEDA
jgi:hypothetical protein